MIWLILLEKYSGRSQPFTTFSISVCFLHLSLAPRSPSPLPFSVSVFLLLAKELDFSSCAFRLFFSAKLKEKVLKEKLVNGICLQQLRHGPCFLSPWACRRGEIFDIIFIYNVGKRVILFVITFTEDSRNKGCWPSGLLNAFSNFWVSVVSLDS